jgi:hypothetical protein
MIRGKWTSPGMLSDTVDETSTVCFPAARRHGTIWRVVLTAWILMCSTFVTAQDSFLSQFRTVNDSRVATDSDTRPNRPDFLDSLSKTADDSTGADDDHFEQSAAEASRRFDSDGNRDTIEQRLSPEHSGVMTAGQTDHLMTMPPLIDGVVATEGCGPANDQLVRFRKSCFQGAQFNLGYLNDDASTGIAVTTLEAFGTFAIPIEGMDNVVSIIPYIRADQLDAAAALDVPDNVYDTGVKFLWRRPVHDSLSSMIMVTPSIRSDFETSDGAFRLFGMALLTWKTRQDSLSLTGGVVYTGREDFPVLPAMGLLWTPTPEWRLDLQFPSPRLSRRIAKNGADSETWVYLAGVFGGNTWAVTRAGGVEDDLTLSDLRCVMGIEYLLPENRGVFAETGYVFNRTIEYTRVPFEQDLDSAWMVRGGISF